MDSHHWDDNFRAIWQAAIDQYHLDTGDGANAQDQPLDMDLPLCTDADETLAFILDRQVQFLGFTTTRVRSRLHQAIAAVIRVVNPWADVMGAVLDLVPVGTLNHSETSIAA